MQNELVKMKNRRLEAMHLSRVATNVCLSNFLASSSFEHFKSVNMIVLTLPFHDFNFNFINKQNGVRYLCE